jgi:hypothetical protein
MGTNRQGQAKTFTGENFVLHFLLACMSILLRSHATSEAISFKGKDPAAKQK